MHTKYENNCYTGSWNILNYVFLAHMVSLWNHPHVRPSLSVRPSSTLPPGKRNLAKFMPSDYIHFIKVHDSNFHCKCRLPNFPCFGDIRHFVFSPCYPMGLNDKVQCQLFQQWTHFNGSLVHWYILTHDPFILWGQSWPLTLETRSPDVQNT